MPASPRPPFGKTKRAVIRLPTSVHDDRIRCSRSPDSAFNFPRITHLRIPANVNARRSATTFLGEFPPIGFATGARVLPVTSCSKSTAILPVERVGGVLCRPRRCGKRASTAVHSAASVSCAFSMPPARSIGRPRRDWRRAGSGLASLRGCRPAWDAHVVSRVRVFGARCVRRSDRPCNSMRCASWSRRSQMASAWLASPMTACQSVTGN